MSHSTCWLPPAQPNRPWDVKDDIPRTPNPERIRDQPGPQAPPSCHRLIPVNTCRGLGRLPLCVSLVRAGWPSGGPWSLRGRALAEGRAESEPRVPAVPSAQAAPESPRQEGPHASEAWLATGIPEGSRTPCALTLAPTWCAPSSGGGRPDAPAPRPPPLCTSLGSRLAVPAPPHRRGWHLPPLGLKRVALGPRPFGRRSG